MSHPTIILDQIKQTGGVITPSDVVEYHHFYYSAALFVSPYKPQRGVFCSQQLLICDTLNVKKMASI